MIAARPTESNTMRSDSSGTDVNVSTARPQPTANSGCPPATNVPDPSSVGEDATPQPQQKPRRDVTMEDVPIRVERAEHVIQGAPSTVEVVDRRHLATLRNKAAQINTLRATVKRKKHTGSPLSKRLLASALVSAPGFSLTGANLPFHLSLLLS
jgi:hypothetical protein